MTTPPPPGRPNPDPLAPPQVAHIPGYAAGPQYAGPSAWAAPPAPPGMPHQPAWLPSPGAHSFPGPPGPVRRRSPLPWVLAGVGLLLVVALAVGTMLFLRGGQAEQVADAYASAMVAGDRAKTKSLSCEHDRRAIERAETDRDRLRKQTEEARKRAREQLEELSKQIPGLSLPNAPSFNPGQFDDIERRLRPTSATVSGLTTSGDHGSFQLTARTPITDSMTVAYELVRESGGWKVCGAKVGEFEF